MAARAHRGDRVECVAAGDQALRHELERELMGHVVAAVCAEGSPEPVGVDLLEGVVKGWIVPSDLVLAGPDR